MLQKLTRRIPGRRRRPEDPGLPSRVKANGPAAADVDGFPLLSGAGGGWNRAEYGEYYASSTPVYAAIRLRADALSRPPVVVYRRAPSQPDGQQRLPVGPEHPAQRLLDRVNRWYTRADLWRATEIYLNLWGSAYWMLDRDAHGNRELWPLRPDRVSIVPDKRRLHPGLRLPRAQPHDRPHPRRGGLVPLLQPAGGVRRPVSRSTIAHGGGHGQGRPALQPQLPAQLGPARLRAADQRVHERRRGGRLLPPLGGPLPRPGQRPPSGGRQLRPRHQDPGPEPPRDGLHSRTALEPRRSQPRLRRPPPACCPTWSEPPSPTSTPPSASSGATPWSPR